jgi:hypothetical protein
MDRSPRRHKIKDEDLRLVVLGLHQVVTPHESSEKNTTPTRLVLVRGSPCSLESSYQYDILVSRYVWLVMIVLVGSSI